MATLMHMTVVAGETKGCISSSLLFGDVMESFYYSCDLVSNWVWRMLAIVQAEDE